MPASKAIVDAQRDVIVFLSDPASYDPRPATVRRIDTHGAHVFLTDGEVIKIKRAVHYPYMDFSTLEKRRSACARELEINSVNAPAIYKRLAAISRDLHGRLAINGPGEVVEWAVQMVRFPEEDVLSNRIALAALTTDEAKALADAVYSSHRRAAVHQNRPREASLEMIADDILAALPSLFAATDGVALHKLSTSVRGLLVDVHPLLARRAANGHVRRCHGDLHLANIVLIEGTPTLFDAIEFDEALATIDTLYDLAFLLMDLDKRGHRVAANVVLNRYLWRSQDTSDIDALRALPVFLALRAAIRAMVGAQRAVLADHNLAEPRSYLDRAFSYLRQDVPALVLIGGFSGSGKSTLAAALAPRLGRAPGALHLRSDLERKALFGAQEYDTLPLAAYSKQATARVYDLMLRKAEGALRAGHCVIADAVHADLSERDAMAAMAERTGARLHAFWLDAPPEVLIERVANRKNDASDATPQVVKLQMSYDLGELEWTRLDASGRLEETLGMAVSHLHASISPP